MVELADTPVSEAGARKGVGVRIPLVALAQVTFELAGIGRCN